MAEPPNGRDGGAPSRLTIVAGLGMVVVDVAGAYFILTSLAIPDRVIYAGTALAAVVVGGAFATVVGSRRFGARGSSGDRSTIVRVAEVVVSVTVLTGVAVILGYGGGLLLTLIAALGGPDPATDDGDPLRERLLDWAERNRAFARANGRGELPVRP